MAEAFDKLAPPIQKWVRQSGWQELRYIQSQAIHALMDGTDDLIISASTASGKTEAAFLPLISQLLLNPSDSPGFDLVYIGPLKALISDQTDRLKSICEGLDLPITPWHGDVSSAIKTKALKAPRGILLITPESVEAMFVRRGAQIAQIFAQTRAVIIDELHTFLDTERGVHLRSLLARIEIAVGQPIRRVGLSATLGDVEMAKAYLRMEEGTATVIEARGGEAELRLQLRGYVVENKGPNDESEPTIDLIANHLFEHLRGKDHLVFAGSRQSVELYADRLRALCEHKQLPQEFYPHHASLSRDHRAFVEDRLKDKALPTTAVCTSTLELGLDIGDVTSIAQIGPPYSVASLRQRLGRSGRRLGQPAILRQYVLEAKLFADSHVVDRLRLSLIRSIAMIDLLLEGWCEPPRPQALHLSVLVHQILSVIAERGGASAKRLYQTLVVAGPFKRVEVSVFTELLRALAAPDVDLIEQGEDGLLLLGGKGERVVSHHSFYPVFHTPEEYRLVADGKALGTLPIVTLLVPGMLLIFSGRRWEIEAINDSDRLISVKPAKAGVPPVFGGDPGYIHDTVIQRMFEILEEDTKRVYLDATAMALLEEARDQFRELGFHRSSLVQLDEHSAVIATRAGTVRTNTLALALRANEFSVQTHDGFISVRTPDRIDRLGSVLAELAQGASFDPSSQSSNLVFDKFHIYLTRELLQLDALSSRLEPQSVPALASAILAEAPEASSD